MSADLSKAPEAIKNIRPEHINDLDVRPILQSGGEPFSEIMAAVDETPANGAFRLRATFEPKPLFKVLGSQGWKYWVEYGSGDDWVIWFYQETEETTSRSANSSQVSTTLPSTLASVVAQYPELPKRIKMTEGLWTLDVRDLPPPDPMEITLAVLDQLPIGVRLLQINQRVPQFLFPMLPPRGMGAEILKSEENDVQIEIKRL